LAVIGTGRQAICEHLSKKPLLGDFTHLIEAGL
jgi:hypothetical protein